MVVMSAGGATVPGTPARVVGRLVWEQRILEILVERRRARADPGLGGVDVGGLPVEGASAVAGDENRVRRRRARCELEGGARFAGDQQRLDAQRIVPAVGGEGEGQQFVGAGADRDRVGADRQRRGVDVGAARDLGDLSLPIDTKGGEIP